MPPASLWTRFREELFLGGLLLAFLLMISAQVTTPQGDVLLKRVSYQAVAPLIRLGNGLYGGLLRLWNDYASFRSVVKENERMRGELSALRMEKLQWDALRLEHESLRRLAEYRECLERPNLPARVVGRDLREPWRMVILNRGSAAGLMRDMPVLSAEGAVGRVLMTSLQTAQVQLITDAQSAVSAVHLPTGEQMLLRGQNGPLLKVDHLSDKVPMAVGDVFTTAGLEGVYPEGFVVAAVEKIEAFPGGRREVWARPAAPLLKIRDLLVLLPSMEPEEVPPASSAEMQTETAAP